MTAPVVIYQTSRVTVSVWAEGPPGTPAAVAVKGRVLAEMRQAPVGDA